LAEPFTNHTIEIWFKEDLCYWAETLALNPDRIRHVKRLVLHGAHYSSEEQSDQDEDPFDDDESSDPNSADGAETATVVAEVGEDAEFCGFDTLPADCVPEFERWFEFDASSALFPTLNSLESLEIHALPTLQEDSWDCMVELLLKVPSPHLRSLHISNMNFTPEALRRLVTGIGPTSLTLRRVSRCSQQRYDLIDRFAQFRGGQPRVSLEKLSVLVNYFSIPIFKWLLSSAFDLPVAQLTLSWDFRTWDGGRPAGTADRLPKVTRLFRQVAPTLHTLELQYMTTIMTWDRQQDPWLGIYTQFLSSSVLMCLNLQPNLWKIPIHSQSFHVSIP
jgi:hypothetical protein